MSCLWFLLQYSCYCREVHLCERVDVLFMNRFKYIWTTCTAPVIFQRLYPIWLLLLLRRLSQLDHRMVLSADTLSSPRQLVLTNLAMSPWQQWMAMPLSVTHYSTYILGQVITCLSRPSLWGLGPKVTGKASGRRKQVSFYKTISHFWKWPLLLGIKILNLIRLQIY